LKVDEISHPGKEVEILQVALGKLSGQDLRLLPGRAKFFDKDQGFAQDLAPPALDGYILVGEIFIADLDAQLVRQVFQVMKKSRI
jgi:hypothetical protein